VPQKAQRLTQLVQSPSCLIVHLKRFKYRLTPGGYTKVKLDTLVHFPTKTSLKLSEHFGVTDSVSEYAIHSVIAHTNSSHSGDGGHFLSYCYDPDEDSWYRFDDNSVKRMAGQESPVQYRMALDEIESKHSYILVYRRL